HATARAEVLLTKNQRVTNFVSNKHGALVLRTDNYKREHRDPKRTLITFDTALYQTGSTNFNLPFRQKLWDAFGSEERLHVLYFDQRFGAYTLVHVDPIQHSLDTFTAQLPKNYEPVQYLIFSHFGAFILRNKKELALHIVDLESKQSYTAPIVGKEGENNVEIKQFQSMYNGQEMCLIYSQHWGAQQNLFIRTFNSDGLIEEEYNMLNQQPKVISIQAVRVEADLRFFGTCSAYETGAYSTGIYTSTNNWQENASFNPRSFIDFKNYLNYLPENQQYLIKSRQDKRAVKGKETEWSALILPGTLMFSSDRIWLYGLAFEPTQRSMVTTTTINGRSVVGSKDVFDGYLFTHLFVQEFDQNGFYLNDYSMPVRIYPKPMDLTLPVHALVLDTSLALLYHNENELLSAEIYSDSLYKFQPSYVQQMHDGDQLQLMNSNLNTWGEKAYLMHGFQRIKNKEDEDIQRMRDVYFIQKIERE
ncbi:MAG: hypothetical protein ACI9NN_002052, partial [Bacteroidia bacterium]